MKKWKKFAALGLAGIMVFSLSACGGGSDTQEAAPAPALAADETDAADGAPAEETDGGSAQEAKEYEPVTLTFWNGFTSTDGEVLQQIVDDFNASNEWNITI